MCIEKQDLLTKGLTLIPVNELSIEKDESLNTGYDLTVEDYYTFASSDGVFVQDCMAVYIPVTNEAKFEIVDKIMINKNLINPANGDLVTEPSQDIVLGIYTLTEDENPAVEYKSVKMSHGRMLFNRCLPDKYPPINKTITKKLLKLILNRISKSYPNEIVEVLDKIKDLGFKHSTKHGYTLSIMDLYNKQLCEIADGLDGKYENDITYMRTNKELDSIMRKMNFSTYIDSGARGSWDQARQMVFTRGYVADSSNKIRPNIIRSSFVRGLTQEEFFHSSYGSRKGLLNTALSTSDSGYLTRQLIYATHFVELDNNLDDCGTNDCLKMELKILNDDKTINQDKTLDLIKSITGRYYKLDENSKYEIVSEDNEENKNLIGKTIYLRSPIYCNGTRICKKCYGESYKNVVSNQIGMVASQSLGERLTQLILQIFHNSGVVKSNSKNTSSDNDDIISGMSLVKTILHKPDLICLATEPEKLVNILYKLFSQYGKIYLVHFEVIVSAMAWNNDKLWRIVTNRDQEQKRWVSVLKIPSLQSWLIGCAFSNLKSELLRGLVKNKEDIESSLSSLFRY